MLLTVLLVAVNPLWAQQPGTWSPAADLNHARQGHTATVLPDGKVLIVGGKDASGQALATAEFYDPATGQYIPLAAQLPVAVWDHTATLLRDGQVLLAGGKNSVGNPVASLQLFDASAGGFTTLPPMSRPRSQHTATLLKDGRVLIAGGSDGPGALPTLEVYDPGW